jgi:hypothetical protein
MFENVKNTAARLSHDFTQTVSNAIAEPEGYHPSEAGKAAQGLRRLSVDPPQSQGVAAGSPVAGRESFSTLIRVFIKSDAQGVGQQVRRGRNHCEELWTPETGRTGDEGTGVV